MTLDILEKINTPAYVIDIPALKRNLEILKQTEAESGCHILLAQKCYSIYQTYPLIAEYISGCTGSGLFEAMLGWEEMGKENHVFAPAYNEVEFNKLLKICDHISFNSVGQWEKHKDKVFAEKNPPSCGLRINPECSTQQGHAIYDPCAPFSRLGITRENLRELPEGIEGLHFHTLCEQNSDALAKTWEAADEKFGVFFEKVKWINLGGGHHITKTGYDRELLVSTIKSIKNKYPGTEIYLEPGEAIALNAGYLVTSVMDIVHNGMDIAIMDASAACHMPDVLEMPYRPEITGAGNPGEKPYTVRLGGNTCLAGDIIGDYSFDHPLKVGEKLIFQDMAIYSMVKNNTFNGIRLPDIWLLYENGEVERIKSFGYGNFKERL